MTGTYPALCNHNLLTPAQAQQVHDAEARHAIVRTTPDPSGAWNRPTHVYKPNYHGYSARETLIKLSLSTGGIGIESRQNETEDTGDDDWI